MRRRAVGKRPRVKLTLRAWAFALAGFILYAAGANSSSVWVIALASVMVTAPLLALSDVRRMRDTAVVHASCRRTTDTAEMLSVTVWTSGTSGAASYATHPETETATYIDAEDSPAELGVRFRRGRHHAVSLLLHIEDRFGMVHASVPIEAPLRSPVVCLPAPAALPAPTASIDGPDGADADRVTRARGIEPYGIRRHESGDPAHAVNWRALARTGELMVHDRRAVADSEVTLAIAGGTWDRDALDRATEQILAVAVEHQSAGHAVWIAADGRRERMGPRARHMLALLPPHAGARPRPLAPPDIRGESIVVDPDGLHTLRGHTADEVR